MIKNIIIILVVTVITAGFAWRVWDLTRPLPSNIKYIYVVPMSHLDIGYTNPPDVVAQKHKDIIDGVIRNCLTYPDFYWTVETTWQLEQWLQRTSDPEMIDQLFNLVREGRISIGAVYATEHSGFLGLEKVNRLVYPAKHLEAT